MVSALESELDVLKKQNQMIQRDFEKTQLAKNSQAESAEAILIAHEQLKTEL